MKPPLTMLTLLFLLTFALLAAWMPWTDALTLVGFEWLLGTVLYSVALQYPPSVITLVPRKPVMHLIQTQQVGALALATLMMLGLLFLLTFALLAAWMPWAFALKLTISDWVMALGLYIFAIKTQRPIETLALVQPPHRLSWEQSKAA